MDPSDRRLSILVAATYYRPYVSGPIVYVERLAHELILRGHHVTILTSQYDRSLPEREVVDEIHIIREPVAARVSKGVLMPGFAATAWRQVGDHDVVAIQIPQFEAPLLALFAKLRNVPATMTYNCDVQLPAGVFNRVVDRIVLAGNVATAALTDRIIAYTHDYAVHSPVMRRFIGKVDIVPPPVTLNGLDGDPVTQITGFRRRYRIEGEPVIGICARFATEKGFEHLIDAIPLLRAEFPDVCVVHVGEFDNVIGEEAYRNRLAGRIAALGDRYRTIGMIDDGDLAAFYRTCDVTVLPSLNRTESFGLVQVESMLCGTPVVASDLAGVRVPIRTTGMGRIAPVGDSAGLARELGAVLRDPERFRRPQSEVAAQFSMARCSDGYLAIWSEALLRRRRKIDARNTFWKHRRDVPWFRALMRACEADLYADLGPLAEPVLDIGCGDGHFASTLWSAVDVGVDLDHASLTEAGRASVHRGLVRADATALPFPDATFATVISNCVIEHIDDMPAVVAEARRVLRPGGRFVLTVPTPRLNDELGINRALLSVGLRRGALRYRRWFTAVQRHTHMLSPTGWEGVLEAAGFEVDANIGYMGARAARLFDLGHFAGVPNLVTRAVIGRWVVWPWRPRFVIGERLAAPAVAERDPPDATGCFIVARVPGSAAA